MKTSYNPDDPDRTYSLKEFEKINGTLKVHEVQNGAPTTSQGGFDFGEGIRAPDVAFTPSEVYRGLDENQLLTFQGNLFSPTFVVEVENVSVTRKLNELTDKFTTTYFLAGVELGWLVDPVNQEIYVFMRDKDNVVRRRNHDWYDDDGNPTVVDGRDILPGFKLQLWRIDEAISQESSESEPSDDEETACPKCPKTFNDAHEFMEHFEDEHNPRKLRTFQYLHLHYTFSRIDKYCVTSRDSAANVDLPKPSIRRNGVLD